MTSRWAALGAACLCGIGVLSAQEPSPAPTRPSFSEWLDGVRADALARGIRPEIVDQALATVEEPEPTVIERDRTQAETVLSLETYLARQLRPHRHPHGASDVHAPPNRARRDRPRYGVSPRLIVAIWGLESNFGKFTGVRPTIGALATLAWDPRRSTFFRGELLSAMEILDRGDIDVARMRGSWAGAMGQPQFMPSSYLKWAEDFDGDGRRDIWSTPSDVFASIANYLQAHGWKTGQTWGREVTISREVAQTDRQRRRPARRLVRRAARHDGRRCRWPAGRNWASA